eukprot:6469723-Amphidinium_carterae.1
MQIGAMHLVPSAKFEGIMILDPSSSHSGLSSSVVSVAGWSASASMLCSTVKTPRHCDTRPLSIRFVARV